MGFACLPLLDPAPTHSDTFFYRNALVFSHLSNMICGVAGITSDANILINYVQTAAQQYLYTYNEDMPCEQLVQRLCDLKQGYTQYGGKT